MRSTHVAWLSTGAALVGLGLASLPQLQSPPTASAASTGHVAQALDPTLQALATQAALALTQAAAIPTPNPTDVARTLGNSGAIAIQGSLSITGAAQVTGTYTTQLLNIAGIRPDLVSCAAFAQGISNADGSGWSVPYPGVGATVDGHTVLIPVAVSPYPGPGDYTGDQGVQLGPGVVIDDTSYLVADATQAYRVTVKPDGSGSFTFNNLHAGSLTTGAVSSATISGSDVWTCSPQP